jgi:Uma2 family endonuclease
MVVAEKLYTADELARLPGARRYELVKGELVEMSPPGMLHGRLAIRLASAMNQLAESRKLGQVFVEAGYYLERHPDTVRGPDISFLSAARIEREGLPEEGFFSGAPDLAVEIVSPGDLDAEVQGKVKDYLDHGCQLVWVIRPRQQAVTAHHPDGTARILGLDDTLEGEAVLPGFSLPLRDLFG